MKLLIGSIFIALIFLAPLGALAKSNCVSKELKLMNCEIALKKAQYSLSKDSMRINDGTWRGVFYWPDAESVVEWHTTKLRELGGKRLLVTKVWKKEPSVPSLDLESLHWVIYEIQGTKVELKIDKIVQKRRRGAGSKEKPAGDYMSGKLETHVLKMQDDDVIWKLGHSKGNLDEPEATAEIETE